jgi:hypothetical protein
MSNVSLERILADIGARYGSPETPDYHLVNAARAERSYQGIIDDLLQRFYVNDATNLNQDVSVVLLIRSKDRADSTELMLQLSLVGPYAVLLELMAGGPRLVDMDDIRPTTREIAALLAKWNLWLVPAEILSEPVHLKLLYTEPENVHVYQAVFSDVDMLPWQAKSGTRPPAT